MYICNYCGRYLKKKYEKCPACGSTSFKKIQNYGEEIIKTPPKDGYKINLANFEYEKKTPTAITIFEFCILGFIVIFFLIIFNGFNIFNDVNGIFNITLIAFFIIFLAAIIKIFSKILENYKKTAKVQSEKIKKIKYLSKHGILIKNLKYEIKEANKSNVGKDTVYIIQIIYEIEKGKTKCFKSEPKYLTALGRDDGTVDLLIDPNDYSNYFIDFEIY